MNVSTKQRRIAELAKQSPGMSFHSLSHHMDVDWLREAYGKLKKSSSPGSDGVTVEAYGRNLNGNLTSLLDRAKSGRYYAPPGHRRHVAVVPPDKSPAFTGTARGAVPQATRPL